MSKKLLTITEDYENAAVKTNNDPIAYLIEKEYSEEEYAAIRLKADEWNVEIEHEDGCNYGYGNHEFNRHIFYEEIGDDILVVQNGHFAGIIMKSSGHSYNNGVTVYNGFRVAFAEKYVDKKAVFCARCGESFYSDDHEKWDIDCYYLRKKEDNLKTNQGSSLHGNAEK